MATMLDQKTKETINPPVDATSLVLGRRDGEGVLVRLGDTQVFIVVFKCEKGQASIRISASPEVKLHRIKDEHCPKRPAKPKT